MKVINGDCLVELKKLEAKCADLILIDPPYNIGKDDWDKLKYHLGILPLGLSRIEVQVLEHLRKKAECSLTNIAAATGLTVQCIRQDFEMYLQKQGLMQITTKGRSLTNEGHKYLKALEGSEK